LTRYFSQRLIQQRHASPHTIRSYRDTFVNDHLNGAIPGSVYWSHPGIGLMEPPQDRPIGAT